MPEWPNIVQLILAVRLYGIVFSAIGAGEIQTQDFE